MPSYSVTPNALRDASARLNADARDLAAGVTVVAAGLAGIEVGSADPAVVRSCADAARRWRDGLLVAAGAVEALAGGLLLAARRYDEAEGIAAASLAGGAE